MAATKVLGLNRGFPRKAIDHSESLRENGRPLADLKKRTFKISFLIKNKLKNFCVLFVSSDSQSDKLKVLWVTKKEFYMQSIISTLIIDLIFSSLYISLPRICKIYRPLFGNQKYF